MRVRLDLLREKLGYLAKKQEIHASPSHQLEEQKHDDVRRSPAPGRDACKLLMTSMTK